ncbi:MAG: class I SAM-dependent DNA methyltransferase [Candidatus Geothermincolia bacterium]
MENGRSGSRPYGELAAIYDELVGATAFDCWLDNFTRLVNRNEVHFDVAADIACGTGLAAAHLARMCGRVYAVDISEQMLEVARRRDGAGNIVFLRQGFSELDLPEQVDLLTCNFDSLNYLTVEEELCEALLRFGRSTRPGGHAIFDMNTCRQLEAARCDSVLVHRTSGGVSIWESSWDPGLRMNTLHMTNFIEDRHGLYSMSEEVHRERAYDIETIGRALREAGFTRIEAFDAKGLSMPGSDTRRVQFIARK